MPLKKRKTAQPILPGDLRSTPAVPELSLGSRTCANESLDGTSQSTRTSPWRTTLLTVTQPLFESFQHLIYGESGIWLGNSKQALLCGRLARRLRAVQVATLAEYHQFVTQPEQYLERLMMIDAITTNETHFFREPKHFEFLAREIVPRWRRRAEQQLRSKTIRLWSAGCSSGEEPYSLAMSLANDLPASEGWDVQILATDISTRMLAKARDGIYSMARSRDIPESLLHRFMLKGIAGQEGRMKASREIQQMVQFARINLSQGPFPIGVPFDLILCRNVLIYFDVNSKRQAVNNLAKCLSHDGLFLIGHAENLSGLCPSVRSLAPTIYCKVENYAAMADEFQARWSGRP
jgi:chemotaxis protein methyltransferase CheR